MSTVVKTKVPSALRHLHRLGADALKPTKMIPDASYHPINTRQKWYKPKVSKRVANTLRKKAIREGTYGSYDAMNGVGWDPSWDLTTTINSNANSSSFNSSNIPWMEIRPHKESKRERTREARANKIEDMLTMADDKILDYRLAQKEKKPEQGIENLIKNMVKASRK